MPTITSTQTGNFADGPTWVGGVAPISTDDFVIAATHGVTVAAGDTVAGGVVNFGGELIVGAFLFTLDGNITNNGIVTQDAGSDVTFNGNYDIIAGDLSIWNINGTSGNRAALQAAATFGFSIQDAGNSLATHFYASYCDFTRWGRADAAADHALYWHSGSKTSNFELTNCLIKTYWRIRSFAGTALADSTFKFINCDYRDPQMNTGQRYAAEYTTSADFNAGTRGWWNCTLVGQATSNKLYIDAGTAVWTNPLIVSNCVGEDIIWFNRFSNYVESDFVTHFRQYTTAASTDVLFSNRSTAQGGWVVKDSVIGGSNSNAHNTADSGGDNGTPSTPGTWRDNIIFGVNTADNHGAFSGGNVNWLRNITVGGNGIVSTSANSGTILIERHTHIHKAGNFDNLLNFETNNFAVNSITARSLLLIGISDVGERGLGSNTTPQDLAYTDFNCWYQIADHYEDITVANDTLTEGVSAGFGASDITANPQVNNANADIATWNTSLGGAGTEDAAYAEMIKLNGFDLLGSPAVFDGVHTKAALLTYLRYNYAPTNIALQGAGFGGDDIGALDVIVALKSISDAKLLKLETATSSTGTIDDLESEWLLSLLGAYTGPEDIASLYHAYWDVLTIPAGHYNDRAYTWLSGLGHTGSLPDRWYTYWNS